MNKTKQCPECKNILDISAFSWYGDVCNGCGAFKKEEIKTSTPPMENKKGRQK